MLIPATLPCAPLAPVPTPVDTQDWLDASLVTKNLGVIRPLLEALLLPFSNDAVEESGLAQIGDGEGVWQLGDEPLEWERCLV